MNLLGPPIFFLFLFNLHPGRRGWRGERKENVPNPHKCVGFHIEKCSLFSGDHKVRRPGSFFFANGEAKKKIFFSLKRQEHFLPLERKKERNKKVFKLFWEEVLVLMRGRRKRKDDGQSLHCQIFTSSFPNFLPLLIGGAWALKNISRERKKEREMWLRGEEKKSPGLVFMLARPDTQL